MITLIIMALTIGIIVNLIGIGIRAAWGLFKFSMGFVGTIIVLALAFLLGSIYLFLPVLIVLCIVSLIIRLCSSPVHRMY